MIKLLFATLSFFGPIRAATPVDVSVLNWGKNLTATPTQVQNLPTAITQIQAANWGGLALDQDGTVFTWKPKLDKGTLVKGPTSVISIGEGGGTPFGAAATSSGTVWTWGADGDGQLCNGTTGRKFKPGVVSGLPNSSEVSGGQEHLLILSDAGNVYACGNGSEGQLGNGSFLNSSTPVQVSGLSNITEVSSGDLFSLAMNSSGEVFAWGLNDYGQLGNKSTTNEDSPVEVDLPSPAAQIFAGGSEKNNGSGIALLRNGQVWSWGNNFWGQLGTGVVGGYSDTPVQVSVPEGVTVSSVAMGGADSFLLTSTGVLYGWGEDKFGQVGNGETVNDVPKPTQVATGISQISATASIAVAIQKQPSS